MAYISGILKRLVHFLGGDFTANITRVNALTFFYGKIMKIKTANVCKKVEGKGFFGEGPYKSSHNGKVTRAYTTWKSMLRRCYNSKNLILYPTYKGCSVHNDWLNFQFFAKWHEKEPNSEKKGFQLDKDLRISNNKIYGPETCSYVPQEINKLLTNCEIESGNLPKGVYISGKKFVANLRANNRTINLGVYDTPELASDAYKIAKSAYVKFMSVELREVIHPEVYAYLNTWEYKN